MGVKHQIICILLAYMGLVGREPRVSSRGEKGGESRWGGVWGVLSRKKCMYTRTVAPQWAFFDAYCTTLTNLVKISGWRSWLRMRAQGLCAVLQNFLHAGHCWLNWPECLHISTGASTNHSCCSHLVNLISQPQLLLPPYQPYFPTTAAAPTLSTLFPIPLLPALQEHKNTRACQ